MKHRERYLKKVGAAGVTLGLCLASAAVPAQEDGWKADVFYENDSRYRAEDATGESVGWSKLRNTLQLEIDGGLGAGWELHSVLRGTWDGVYDVNDGQFGEKAGGGILLNSQQGTFPISFGPQQPHGGGAVDREVVAATGKVNNEFGFNSTDPNAPGYNPNAGLRVLGDRWNPQGDRAAFGVPVRPCDTDARGCVDFGGYGDLDKNELAFAEFNDRLDFLRELYVTNYFAIGEDDQLFVKVGRQQVIWGRTDLFRVLDVINPVDFSRNNIYDELEDIRIPMWIATAEWRMGATGMLQDSNLQLVWNFDEFRPNTLGQGGTPNAILDAGNLFRGLVNLWNNGGTVANFANIAQGTFLSTDFGPGQIGIRNVELPEWQLSNTQIGAKYEGVTAGGIAFSLNALNYRSQLPSLRGGRAATNSFTGDPCDDGNDRCPFLIAFDMVYPRVNLFGGSADFEWQAAGAAIRLEGAYTQGEEFPNTLNPELYTENDVFRSVIGIDRPFFIPFISKTRTTLVSGQLFYQHIFDHELEQRQFGKAGMPDWEDNAIATLLIKAFLVGDRVSPQIITAYDVRAKALVVEPAIEWLFNDHLKITAGANLKALDGLEDLEFDDCRSCNPFAPDSAPNGDPDPDTPGSRGLSGIEPLGRFRAGPIGAAWKEDEVFLKARYAF